MKNDEQHIQSIHQLIEVLQKMLPLVETIAIVGDKISAALKTKCKLLTAGNGGSAADAMHLAEELVGRFQDNRSPLPAISLASDPTLITCIGNDFGFDNIFSRQVEAIGNLGDVLVVFSTSGNSENIVRAIEAARRQNLYSVALLGKAGGRAKGLADSEIIIPSNSTANIQEMHTFILHCWLRQIEFNMSSWS